MQLKLILILCVICCTLLALKPSLATTPKEIVPPKIAPEKVRNGYIFEYKFEHTPSEVIFSLEPIFEQLAERCPNSDAEVCKEQCRALKDYFIVQANQFDSLDLSDQIQIQQLRALTRDFKKNVPTHPNSLCGYGFFTQTKGAERDAIDKILSHFSTAVDYAIEFAKNVKADKVLYANETERNTLKSIKDLSTNNIHTFDSAVRVIQNMPTFQNMQKLAEIHQSAKHGYKVAVKHLLSDRFKSEDDVEMGMMFDLVDAVTTDCDLFYLHDFKDARDWYPRKPKGSPIENTQSLFTRQIPPVYLYRLCLKAMVDSLKNELVADSGVKDLEHLEELYIGGAPVFKTSWSEDNVQPLVSIQQWLPWWFAQRNNLPTKVAKSKPQIVAQFPALSEPSLKVKDLLFEREMNALYRGDVRGFSFQPQYLLLESVLVSYMWEFAKQCPTHLPADKVPLKDSACTQNTEYKNTFGQTLRTDYCSASVQLDSGYFAAPGMLQAASESQERALNLMINQMMSLNLSALQQQFSRAFAVKSDLSKLFAAYACDDKAFIRVFENARRMALGEPLIDLAGIAASEWDKLQNIALNPEDFKADKVGWSRFAYAAAREIRQEHALSMIRSVDRQTVTIGDDGFATKVIAHSSQRDILGRKSHLGYSMEFKDHKFLPKCVKFTDASMKCYPIPDFLLKDLISGKYEPVPVVEQPKLEYVPPKR